MVDVQRTCGMDVGRVAMALLLVEEPAHLLRQDGLRDDDWWRWRGWRQRTLKAADRRHGLDEDILDATMGLLPRRVGMARRGIGEDVREVIEEGGLDPAQGDVTFPTMPRRVAVSLKSSRLMMIPIGLVTVLIRSATLSRFLSLRQRRTVRIFTST